MPDRPDLPAVATPWEDPLGNVWCVVPISGVDRDEWVKVYRWTSTGWDHWHTAGTFNIHPALLAGLGQERPWRPTPADPTQPPCSRCGHSFADLRDFVAHHCPMPPADPTPPKRVAKVVSFGGWDLAAKQDQLYERLSGDAWRPATSWAFTRGIITAAAEAFAGAGDVLPGESE